MPITEAFVETGANGERFAKVRSIVEKRCVSCHRETSSNKRAAKYPLDTYGLLAPYTKPEPMPLKVDRRAEGVRQGRLRLERRAEGFAGGDDPKLAQACLKAVREDLDGERLALVHWLREGASKEDYVKDAFALTGERKNLPVTETFVKTEGDTRFARIRSIIDKRCVRCHIDTSSSAAFRFPLQTWGELVPYTRAEAATGHSLTKLALTTHVHLLGFSVLYGLTGLVFAFSSYPGMIRLVLAPLPLLAQIVDISFWWLARLDPPHGPLFAQGIILTGGIVGASLGLQILLSLFNLFGKLGKLVLVLLLAASVAVGFYVKTSVIDKQIKYEKGLEKVETERRTSASGAVPDVPRLHPA